FKAPLKCGRCQTARYCGKDCQRAHWPQHKEYCAIWSQLLANEGVSLSQIKVKMGHFIWLLRGFTDLEPTVPQEYEYHHKKGLRGFMEFHFDSCEKLFKAVDLLQSQPITDPNHHFFGMPGSLSYTDVEASGKPADMKLALRKLRTEDEEVFMGLIDDCMVFTSSDTRENLQKLLDLAMLHKHMLVVSVTVVLTSAYSTHLYDFLYRNINWVPEPSPEEMGRK
ncbi:hypothetical protein K488DRAFT_51022, partial [Vararia minispora EC-137]